MVGVFQSKIGNIVFTNEVKLLDLIFLYQIAIGSLPVTLAVKSVTQIVLL